MPSVDWMPLMTKTVRSVDAEAYRAFRAKAVELGCSTGEALSEAMRLWVNARSRPRVTVRAQSEPSPAAVAGVDTTLPASST
jgi:hypothetical protein